MIELFSYSNDRSSRHDVRDGGDAKGDGDDVHDDAHDGDGAKDKSFHGDARDDAMGRIHFLHIRMGFRIRKIQVIVASFFPPPLFL